MKAVLLILLIMCSSSISFSEEAQTKENECPMHSEHMKDQHRKDVDRRGDQVMGFSHLQTKHHFSLDESGGAIQVSATDMKDEESIKAIRNHLMEISKKFKSGDFLMPQKIHGQIPPGSETMAELKDQIEYRFEEIPAGAKVIIRTKNVEALSAIHDFLNFQIEDHGTAREP